MPRTLKVGDSEVTRIGLGTNRLANTSENEAFLKEAVNAGVNFIDTAHLYAGGDSERTIGAALAPFGEDCIVATKGGFHDGRPEVLQAELEESFRRLQTDVIALYYLHRVDTRTPLETSLDAINQYRERGKVRHIGISAVGVNEIKRARQVVPVAAVQNHYNLSERRYEDVVDYCAQEQIPFVPYYPLHTDGGSAVAEIAANRGAHPEQIALAWLLKRSPMMTPIPGTLSAEHLRQNLAALEIELTDAEYAALA